MKINFYKAYWFLYLIEFVIPIVLLSHYLFGSAINAILIKIPFILYYLLLIIYHINQKLKFKFSFISYLFLFYFFFSLFVGLLEGNNIDGKFLSHIYYTSMPILGISFGISFAQSYDQKFENYFIKLINFCFYITTIILLVYGYSYFISGSISYWGFGTDLHLIIPFILYQGRYFYVIIAFLLVLLSGKRATLLNVAMEFLLIFSYKLKSITLRSFPKIIFSIILIFVLFTYALNQGAFKRFDATIDYDISDETSMMYATGGRWTEITGIIDYHNSKPYRWFTGAGFGGRYLWYLPLENSYESKHYAHFSPVSYIFIYGTPFMIILYFSFLYYFKKSLKYVRNPFVIIFIIGIFSSFFGANLFVDIKLWVFCGIFLYILKNPYSAISKLKIFKS